MQSVIVDCCRYVFWYWRSAICQSCQSCQNVKRSKSAKCQANSCACQSMNNAISVGDVCLKSMSLERNMVEMMKTINRLFPLCFIWLLCLYEWCEIPTWHSELLNVLLNVLYKVLYTIFYNVVFKVLYNVVYNILFSVLYSILYSIQYCLHSLGNRKLFIN